MANPRVYAGFYKRYDGKIVYVITTAKDTDTGEETVIFFNYDYFTAISYLTCSKTSFCGTVRYKGKTVKKYRRQPQMPIDDGFIELLNHKGFRGPVRKGYSDSYEIGERSFQTASNYLSYAIDLCSHYKKDLRIYRLCHKYNRLVGITKEDFVKLKEDMLFTHSALENGLEDYRDFFSEHFQNGVSIRKYAETHNMNRGSVEYHQKKLYSALAMLLEERDLSEGKTRINKINDENGMLM